LRHHRLLAAGLAAALLLGAAGPALAAPGKAKGKADAPGQTKQKPAPPPTKGKKGGISGGGTVAVGEFSIQARTKSKSKGHFNYTSTDGLTKVRCRGFHGLTAAPGNPGTASVTFDNCVVNGQPAADIVVEVIDRGQPSVTPPVADHIKFLTVDHDLTDGNIKVR
jgi:hypothetical protein